MSEKKEHEHKMGYEVSVRYNPETVYVFCVDEMRKIRGEYLEGFRHYMSDWELWMDHEGLGTLEGELREGEIVSMRNIDGTLLAYGLVTMVQEVDIEKMIEHAVVAGLDYPIIPIKFDN